MRTFDVTLVGFYGGWDGTDHLVKWVKAESEEAVQAWINRCNIRDIVKSVDLMEHADEYKEEDGVDCYISQINPDDSLIAQWKEEVATAPKICPYCEGNCPNEPEDSSNLCDGYAGDIDGLCAEES